MTVSKWKTIHLIDVICKDNNKSFVFREFSFSENSESVTANLYKVFAFIESEHSVENNAYCLRSNQCDLSIKISVEEFLMILQHLEIVSPFEVKRYSKRAKDIAAKFNIHQSDNCNIEGFPPCIFVDEKDGGCRIYELRPTMCRLYDNTSLKLSKNYWR